jgi:NitT/TauT family transport system permease protein
MRKVVRNSIVLLFILTIWELFVRLLKIPDYILPTPTQILFELYSNFFTLIWHAGITLLETVLGFVIGVSFGLFLALVFANKQPLREYFYPYFVTIKTIPIIALAPLIILWFGHGLTSKVFIVALACFFPVLVNSTKGFLTIARDHIDLFRSLKASKIDTFIHLRLPSALPYIFTGLKVSVTLAVLGAIVGEFIGSDKGLGFLMVLSSSYLETSTLFAAIILTGLIGIGLFSVVNFAERKIVFWVREE